MLLEEEKYQIREASRKAKTDNPIASLDELKESFIETFGDVLDEEEKKEALTLIEEEFSICPTRAIY